MPPSVERCIGCTRCRPCQGWLLTPAKELDRQEDETADQCDLRQEAQDRSQRSEAAEQACAEQRPQQTCPEQACEEPAAEAAPRGLGRLGGRSCRTGLDLARGRLRALERLRG